MHKLKEKIMDALYEYEDKAAKNPSAKLSDMELEKIHKMTDTVKNIDKIEMLEEGGGYSEESNWMGEGRMYGTSYNDGGSSYRRGRGRNAKRDSMGRYSRDGYSEDNYSQDGGSSYRGGSSYERGGNRGGQGYSRGDAKEYMIEQLEEMMENAESPKEKEAIRQCMHKIESV